MESSLPPSVRIPGSSKRARARSGGGGASQAVSCLVDGCKSDLTKCRDYHRRHKVCEQHSKTPRVTIAGSVQRFCQQCSRFHSLLEFDEGKRSCRKRLEGHNRRRRKPQPEIRSVNPSFLSAAQGSRFLPYNNDSSVIPAATSAAAASSSTWSAGVKSEAGTSSSIYSSGRSELSALPSTSYAWGNPFPFLHDSFSPHLQLPPPTSSTHQLFHDHLIPASGNGARGGNNPKDFFSAPASASALSSPNQVMNSDCALSLLSSSPPLETVEIGLGRMMQQPPNSVPNDRPLLTGLSYNSFMGQFLRPEHQGLDVHGTPDGAASLLSNVFQPASCDGPSSSAAHQMLSFSWAL